MQRAKLFAVSSVLTLLLGAAQMSEGQAAATAAATSSHNAEGSSDVGKYSNWDQLAAHQHGSMAFTGKIVIAGGQLPWEPVPVNVTCGDVVRYSTGTDPKGEFAIEASSRPSEISPQPKATGLPNASQLIGCKVNAQLTGFTSKPLVIANRSITDDSSLGTITLERDESAPGAAVSATSGTASKDAVKYYEKAHAAEISHHNEDAEHNLEKAVKASPAFADAWYQLGRLEETQKPQEAWDAYSKAIAADPQFAPPYEHLAAVAAQQKKWQDVADAAGKGLKLNPQGSPQLWYFNAVGQFNLGNGDVAEESARKALAMDPSHVAPNTEQLLAVMLAAKRDYAEALEHLRNCLTYVAPGPNADLIRQQVAQLEKIVPASK
jgi:tetratricopeptide (TPR) repeat protein